ncbi:MAG: hypothetical protein VKK05_09100 [Synechococcus sp.]|nr:hypothetical protein [Synechococcus sp.]
MNVTWRELNRNIHTYTEDQLLEMLTAERQGTKRITVMQRLHQRYNVLRTTRERLELLREAAPQYDQTAGRDATTDVSR